MMMVEVELVEIQLQGESRSQIIILQEKDGVRSVPIFIGDYEAAILDQTVRAFQASRPLTHDLVLNVVDGLGGTLTGILVSELRNETFIGNLLVRTPDGDVCQIDTRPSDAIILAMKRQLPIYVAEEVLAATNIDEDES